MASRGPLVSDHVRNDTHSSLETIQSLGGRKSLASRLEDIDAKHQFKPNWKSLDFIDNLKCFIPSHGKRKRDGGRTVYSTTLRQISPAGIGYVALSYPREPSDGEPNQTGGYSLEQKYNRAIEVRDVVLRRTFDCIEYISNHQNGHAPGNMSLWIDQLSIQKAPLEQDRDMQSMDLVYKECTYVIGYLWAEIETQCHLDLLADLLSGNIVRDNRETYEVGELVAGVDPKKGRQTLALLLHITNDRWWERAWIFQEDYLSGTKMWLLIRHSRGIRKGHLRHALKDLPGEVIVKSAKFKRYATLFCLAYRQLCQTRQAREICDKILRKVCQYNILHMSNVGSGRRGKVMTISILDDLITRKVTYQFDLTAIAANACGYDMRIQAKDKKPSERSSSLLLVALLLRNGEIINNSKGSPGDLSKNVVGFLEDQAIIIDAPLDRQVMTFMKHARLSVTQLSVAGIHSKGMLWRVWKTVVIPKAARNPAFAAQKLSPGSGLDEDQRRGLLWIVRYLRKSGYDPLADDLSEYLRTSKQPSASWHEDAWSSQTCKDIMAAYLVRAMYAGRTLRLGCPVGDGSRRNAPYRAIFVGDQDGLADSNLTHVFTSWTRTEDRVIQNEWQGSRLAKYASLEVELDGRTSSGVSRLRTKRWLNGLCFFDGEELSDFVFPWPKSLF